MRLRRHCTPTSWPILAALLLASCGESAVRSSSSVRSPPPGRSVLDVGDLSACAVLGDGTASCWGANDFGQLGSGKADNLRGLPAPVSGLEHVVAIGVRRYYGCALDDSGQVSCWGDNGSGWLGDKTTTPHWTPAPVIGLPRGAQALDVGRTHSCAVHRSGNVFCWGSNAWGQLGDNSTIDRHHATRVATSLSDFVDVAVGDQHTCALRANGEVWCWGDNSDGKLGDGSHTNRLAPVKSAVVDATAISAGLGHTCAVLADGSVRCWGANQSGEAGPAASECGHTPPCPPVAGLADVQVVSAGNHHTCALTTHHQVYCWGRDDLFQLGGARISADRPSISGPVLMPGIDAVAIAAGAATSCAVTTDGRVLCWGANIGGAAGDGSATLYPVAAPNVVKLAGAPMSPR